MAEEVYSVYNPDMGAPIDTIVEGVRYEIPGGETFAEVQRAHAESLQNTYPWLELSAGGKPVTSKGADADGDDADKAPAPKTAAAKKTAAKAAKKVGKSKK